MVTGACCCRANLREFGQLTRDAMLIGQGLRFELWDEGRWNERRDEWLASAGRHRLVGRTRHAVVLAGGRGE